MGEGSLDDITFEHIEKEYDSNICEESNAENQEKKYHIIQTFYERKIRKELLIFGLVRFNQYERYDIRKWYDEGTKPGKGLSITYAEIEQLKQAIKTVDLDDINNAERAIYKSEKITAKIYDRICILNSYSVKGEQWNKEVTFVNWGYGLKMDFRKWTDDYNKCGKGISIDIEDAKKIFEMIQCI